MSCFARNDDADAAHFTHGAEEKASCAAMFQAALAPWESTHPLAFAEDALKQLSAELTILEQALSDANAAEGGALNRTIVRRAIVGLESRARVAAEVVSRLAKAEEARQ